MTMAVLNCEVRQWFNCPVIDERCNRKKDSLNGFVVWRCHRVGVEKGSKLMTPVAAFILLIQFDPKLVRCAVKWHTFGHASSEDGYRWDVCVPTIFLVLKIHEQNTTKTSLSQLNGTSCCLDYLANEIHATLLVSDVISSIKTWTPTTRSNPRSQDIVIQWENPTHPSIVLHKKTTSYNRCKSLATLALPSSCRPPNSAGWNLPRSLGLRTVFEGQKVE